MGGGEDEGGSNPTQIDPRGKVFLSDVFSSHLVNHSKP